MKNTDTKNRHISSFIKAARIIFFITLLLNFIVSHKANGQTLTFVTQGSAMTTDFAGCYNLTPNSLDSCTNQSGVIWCTTKLNFKKPFKLTFDATLFSEDGSYGADGIDVVFGSRFTTTVQPNLAGGYLGYYGAENDTFADNSFGIEFDT